MEELWQAIYDMLTGEGIDLWHLKTTPEYSPGTPYFIGFLTLSELPNELTVLATLTLDGYAYGESDDLSALMSDFEDVREALADWRVQDSSDAGSSDTWSLETLQPVADANLSTYRYRGVFTAPFVGQRIADALEL